MKIYPRTALTQVLLTAILGFVLMASGCSKKKQDATPETPDTPGTISAPTTSVATFQVATFYSKELSEQYRETQGTFGGVTVQIRRSGDSSYAFLVPELPAGKHTLDCPMGRLTFTVAVTKVENTTAVVDDLMKRVDAQIEALPAATPDEVEEVNEVRAFKSEVLKLYNSLNADQKRQAALIYEANRASFQRVNANIFNNLNGSITMRQSDCPRTDFKSYYGCTADNLAASAEELVKASEDALEFLALGAMSAYLAPASFGLSAAASTIAFGTAGYLLITEVKPAVTKFRRDFAAFRNINWIFSKALFSTIWTEFETGISTNLRLRSAFHSLTSNDRDLMPSTQRFFKVYYQLDLYWDRLVQVFGTFPRIGGTIEYKPINTADYTITGISNPNVQLEGRTGENVTFKSLSGKTETFSYHIRASKEGFTYEKDVTNARVIPIVDSSSFYRAACVGNWTVYGYDPNNPTSVYTLELKADGTGTYTVPNSTKKYGVSWFIRRTNENEYRLYESGFWHPAYDELTRDRLDYPVTGFKTYANFDKNFVSQRFIKN